MTKSPDPRELGQANSNITIIQPSLASPLINHLPQNNVVREDSVVSYREVENNLFIYSADRDWLRNNNENRYQFSVNFDPAANGQSFGPHLASQQKFKNIVRIELVKAIVPGESLDVTVYRTRTSTTTTTNYQDNILNLPYIIVRVAELENMSGPFSRQDIFDEFSEVLSPATKQAPPGTVGDIIAATTMAETLSVMERALRMRHTMRRIRATCHVIGRKKAHSSDTGPFTQNNVEYLRGLLKQSRQVKGA